MDIPEVKMMHPDSLIHYSLNNKKHPQDQIDKIANSIKEFWFNQPIVIDKDNIIIAWHGRALASQKLGLKEVPVIQKDDLDEKQVKKYRLLDNKLWDLAERDMENIEIDLVDIGDVELSELFDVKYEDIDFDNIQSNEDRQPANKDKEVACPDCWHTFTI